MAISGAAGRLRRYLRTMSSAKKKFRPPPRSDVLIYDRTGSAHLRRVFPELRATELCTRGEEINVPVLLRALFAGGSLTSAYDDCYIRAVRPRLLLTFIDNSVRFYSLSLRHPRVRTMFIQNGARGGALDVFDKDLARVGPRSSYHVDVMCTYGDAIGAEYRKYIGGDVVAIGSMLSNECIRAPGEKVRRIAYISIFDHFGAPSTSAAKVVLAALAEYSKSRGIPLVVVGRTAGDEERDYYRSLIAESFHFQPRTQRDGSYRFLDASEVSVSIDSSLGYETVARGNKNAFFSIMGSFLKSDGYRFGWPLELPDDGAFWTNRVDSAAFDRILDHLFEIDDAQWRSETDAVNFSRLVTYDPGNTTAKAVLAAELR